MNDILERMRAGELILETDPDYPALYRLFEETMSLVGELNTGYHTADGVRALLERIWGQPRYCPSRRHYSLPSPWPGRRVKDSRIVS